MYSLQGLNIQSIMAMALLHSTSTELYLSFPPNWFEEGKIISWLKFN